MKTKLLLVVLILSGFFASANNATLTLRVFLQGFYLGSSTMNNPLYTCGPVTCDPDFSDYVIIYLYDEKCIEVQKEIGILHTDGYVTVLLGSILPLSNITLGDKYWIRVTHRNHVDVWSANTEQINATTSYDFTTGAGQAYGSNQADLGDGNWGMFAGDIYHDCAVDGSDLSILYTAIYNGDGGYVVEDLTGDCAVDGSDYLAMQGYVELGVGCYSPCELDPCALPFRKASPNKSNYNLELSVSPNPATDALEVVTNKEKCELKITNAIGEVVYREQMSYKTTLQISKYPKGIYYLTIERNGVVEGTSKIAVQ